MTQVRPLRLVQITDCHLFAKADKTGHGDINPYQSLQSVLGKVASVKPDLVLLTGDLSNDLSRQSYLNLNHLWTQSGIECPLHIVPGNHDDPALLEELFADSLNWLRAPLESGNWCLHGLDSHYQGTKGKVSDRQLNQLEQNLMTRPHRFHLVAVHHHPKPCESWMDNHPWVNREEFIELLERQPAIRLVVHGHVHADLKWSSGQTDILACPSTCWQWQQSEYFSLADETPGFRVLELDPDGSYQTRIERLSADSFWSPTRID